MSHGHLAKFLLKHLHQFLFIVITGAPVDSSQVFLPFLLNSYVDVIISASTKQVITLTCISKGVKWRLWTVDLIPFPPVKTSVKTVAGKRGLGL
jgi:hypothetical protein